MIVIPNKPIVYIDVDDSLVMWSSTPEELEQRGIDFTCPGSLVLIDGELKPSASWMERLVPHRKHIEHLKLHRLRGHTVVVWSAGGSDWAAAVLKALDIEKYVDLVIPKPNWVIDDLPAAEFMPKSKWMKDDNSVKTIREQNIEEEFPFPKSGWEGQTG